MLSVNPKYKANMKLVATGGVYTFTLFTKTNKFKVSYVNDSQESKTDVHIAGLNIVLDDNDGESNIATATATVAADTYQIKVYNYGVIYTTGENLKDSGSKNLKSFYTTPLNFTAGRLIEPTLGLCKSQIQKSRGCRIKPKNTMSFRAESRNPHDRKQIVIALGDFSMRFA